MRTFLNRRQGTSVLIITLLAFTLACNTPIGAAPTATETPMPSSTPTEVLPSATPTITLTVEPTATTAPEEPTSTPEPTSTFVPPVVPAPNAEYEGISFYRDNKLAATWSVEIIPADIPDTGVPEAWLVPSHYYFVLDGYPLASTLYKPQIYVFPVRNFEDYNTAGMEIIAQMQAFLKEPPTSVSGEIPFFPIFNAAQTMQTQIALLNFQNGSGVRFLTQYAQAAIPINSHEMFYTFQGITNDGQYYVSVIMPAAHASLPANPPANASEYPGGDPDAFANNFSNYIDDIELQLNNASLSSFTPDLEMLDVLVQSLTIRPQ
ncbi:MAG: hypothetical protein JXB30_05575 [Anaerolineae bacterium]|nr:hypothetical protein [Anaerolineae bacterium]